MVRFFFTPLLSAWLALAPNIATAANADASAYIESLGNQTIAIISDKALGREQKQAKLERIFSTNVDIDWIGRFVMGRFWRQATDTQKKTYLAKYSKFLTHHYSSRFAEYTSGSFKITGARQDGDGEYTVNMQIQSQEAGGEPILVDYRVRRLGGGFRIFDVIVEGVSMITTQRSEFGAVISDHGIDYLIENLTVISEKSLPDKPAK